MKFRFRSSAPQWFVRLALSASYLSAVVDRVGGWGSPGAKGVAWGSWDNFVAYAGTLNGFLPKIAHAPVAIVATTLEIAIPIGLLVGWQLRFFALASGLLATSFFLTMIVALGPKSPLDYSVFTVAAASFLLAQASEKRDREVDTA